MRLHWILSVSLTLVLTAVFAYREYSWQQRDARAENRIRQLEQSRSNLSAELTDLEEELSSRKRRNRELDESLLNEQARVEQHEQRIALWQERWEELQAEHEAQSTQVQELREELRTQRAAELERQRRSREQRDHKLQELRTENERLERRLESLQQQQSPPARHAPTEILARSRSGQTLALRRPDGFRFRAGSSVVIATPAQGWLSARVADATNAHLLVELDLPAGTADTTLVKSQKFTMLWPSEP